MLSKPFKNLIVLSLGILSFHSCSARPSNAVANGRVVNYTNCQLPKDQGRGSIMGAWERLPIPVVMDNDFYLTDGGEAMPSLRGAIQTWNRWANVRGLTAFTIHNDGSGVGAGMEIPELTDCSQASYSGAVTDMVGIWKISTYGNHANQRESCGSQLKILPDGVQGQTDWVTLNSKIVGASVLLNFEGFNAPGKRVIDVESLLLHELGHVLGLLHSCNGSTDGASDGTSAPACSTARAAYTDAVMFPFLEVAQQRRQLEQNDYDRINCLY